jgi:elongation factor P
MDQETYDQPGISKDILGESVNYLQEGMTCKLTFYKGEPLDVELPLTVDLKVVFAEVAVRGDTATGVTKKVKVETGAEVQCPNFVKEGDTIRVDTRDGSYVTRV